MLQASRSPDAHPDGLEQWLHVGRHDMRAADRLVEEHEAKCGHLAQTPEPGRRRDELLPGLRSLAVRGHVISYRPEADGRCVLRVIHGSRDLTQLF